MKPDYLACPRGCGDIGPTADDALDHMEFVHGLVLKPEQREEYKRAMGFDQ